MSYTKAPWRVGHYTTGAGKRIVSVDQDIKGPFAEICRIYPLNEAEEKQANEDAGLLAAAPEMFTALCEFLAELEHRGRLSQQTIKMAREAVTKAVSNG